MNQMISIFKTIVYLQFGVELSMLLIHFFLKLLSIFFTWRKFAESWFRGETSSTRSTTAAVKQMYLRIKLFIQY